jgi:hypothetical protein
MAIDRTPPPGSDFPDSVKRKARELAFFKCCYCHDRQGHEVHHLTPKEEGGQGTLDNAILLCVQCHSDYGHRPDKRQQLRQARDHWYEIVAKRYGPEGVAQIANLDELATKEDLAGLESRVTGLFDQLMTGWKRGSTSTSEVVNIGSSMVSSIVAGKHDIGHSSMVFGRSCGNCGSHANEIAMFCWKCGEPLN